MIKEVGQPNKGSRVRLCYFNHKNLKSVFFLLNIFHFCIVFAYCLYIKITLRQSDNPFMQIFKVSGQLTWQFQLQILANEFHSVFN